MFSRCLWSSKHGGIIGWRNSKITSGDFEAGVRLWNVRPAGSGKQAVSSSVNSLAMVKFMFWFYSGSLPSSRRLRVVARTCRSEIFVQRTTLQSGRNFKIRQAIFGNIRVYVSVDAQGYLLLSI